MEAFEFVRLNLLSPMVLAFFLGVLAALLKSDLAFPEPLYTTLSLYLLFAIGFKGGWSFPRPASRPCSARSGDPTPFRLRLSPAPLGA